MTNCIRAFSAHLLLISLLWPSTALQFFFVYYIAFQVNTGVLYLLDYVEDIYDVMLVLSAPVSILNPNLMYLPL